MLNGDVPKRLCVVTPYYHEDRDLLERCLTSVRRQTVPADHIVVADGFPQHWLNDCPIRHIILDQAHGDYGNVARGIGALMAISEKYDGIAFLDADNWFDNDHLATCMASAQQAPDAPYIVAQRDFVRLDGSIIALPGSEDVPMGDHVDTNCYLFLPSSFHLLHYWCTFPRELSSHGDRFFRSILKAHLTTLPAVTDKRTVKYRCLFESIYKAIGESPPPGAKPNVSLRPGLDWLNSLADEDLALVEQMSGLRLSDLTARAAR